ncbi:EAL domain-containing protein [Cohnella sp. CFH 77786]|uniref:EAL domain-containing protein n=1 Tax=Cohnella sp. CFH 77786 TaxID=2662265 RepID=UPI001C60A293
MTSPKLFERIASGLKLFLPDRAIKFFPPDFTLRRPVLSLMEKSLDETGKCWLALFRLEFSRLQHEVPDEAWERFREAARRHLRISAALQLSTDELVVLDQFDRTDYVLLFQISQADDQSGNGIPQAMNEKLERIRSALEVGLQGAVPEWRRNVKIVKACAPIAGSTPAAEPADRLSEAYRLALALATHQLTPQTEVLRKQLEQLLEREAVSVLAQPIMNLTSGDVHGWEILTRGPAESAFHMPDELFRIASQTRLLSRLEFLVVSRALEEVASRGIREPVFLNVTAVTLAHPLFLSHVLKCLERHPGLTASQIYFEITERHEVSDLEAMAEILSSFRKRGFRFAVDDAGAGYSSLQWIGELVPELIKIDRSVIRHVDRVAIKESMLKALMSIAKEMNCDVVAEGVEREEEADVLFRLDVGMGQGYYFARPSALLEEHERGMFQETKERIQHRRGQAAS